MDWNGARYSCYSIHGTVLKLCANIDVQYDREGLTRLSSDSPYPLYHIDLSIGTCKGLTKNSEIKKKELKSLDAKCAFNVHEPLTEKYKIPYI